VVKWLGNGLKTCIPLQFSIFGLFVSERGLKWCNKHVYVGSSGAGCIQLKKNVFLEWLFSDGLEKIASKMA
jgi:hypothetical protein